MNVTAVKVWTEQTLDHLDKSDIFRRFILKVARSKNLDIFKDEFALTVLDLFRQGVSPEQAAKEMIDAVTPSAEEIFADLLADGMVAMSDPAVMDNMTLVEAGIWDHEDYVRYRELAAKRRTARRDSLVIHLTVAVKLKDGQSISRVQHDILTTIQAVLPELELQYADNVPNV